jgi:hypothetical protein
MKIAFAKNSLSPFALAIRLWTWSKYHHCEVVFSDGTTFGALTTWPMKTNYEIKRYNPKYWDFVEIECTPQQEQEIRKWCDGEVGCKYDWNGIFFSQVLPLSREHSTRWFCSEIATAILQKLKMFTDKKPCTISPAKLAKLLGL